VPATAAPKATKQVTFYVDANGKPTTHAAAVGTVTGAVPADQPSLSLLSGDLKSAEVKAALKMQTDALEAKLNTLRSEHANVSRATPAHPRVAELNASMASVSSEIATLKQMASVPELPPPPAPYRPSIDEAGANLLQLQLRLQSLQPLPSLQPPP
jgi:hypothetical protein